MMSVQRKKKLLLKKLAGSEAALENVKRVR